MDEIRSLKEEIRRAERNPNKTSSQRRKAYERVLQLANSTDVASKKLATDTIKDFFADFPEYQDQAINAVYDLCEDPDRDTRLAGYNAIASLSRTDGKWVVRNADVLVQLLQIDDENEVAVVKQILQQHIDLDATRTFKVLCDQCTFDPDSPHPEEAARLRNLVINFLKERYRPCVSRVVKTDEVWDVLFHGLLKAVPQASSDEVVTIFRDILVHTPQFSLSSYRDGATKTGTVALSSLLDNAKESLKAELDSSGTKPKRSAIPRTCMFLALAAYITNPLTYTPPYNGAREGSIPISNRLQKLGHPSTASANAFRLIQFYISLLRPDGLLKPKVFQNRLTKAAAVRVAWYVGRAWEGCEDMMNGSRKLVNCSKSDLQQARDDLVDVSPTLLSIIAQNSLRSIDGGRRLRRSATALIRACVDREQSTKEAWAAPDGFEESLQAVLSLVSNNKVDDSKEAEGWDDVPEEYWGEEAEAAPSPESSERSLKEIENLIRSLLDAKGTDDDQEGETKEQEKNGMDVDAPTAPASVSQATAPAATPTQPKQTSKTTLDVINERRREFEREHERQKASKPFAAQGGNSEQRRSLPQTSSLSVRGAASLGLASKTLPAVDVDMKDNVAPRSTPSVSSDHARGSHGDTRPSKRTKSFPSPFSNEISSSTPSRPVGETMSRTPSLLARLQSSSESVVEVGGGSVASPGSLASRLLSPSLSSSKSAQQKVSATSLDTQNMASRGHRPISGTAASTMSLAIKGQASSLEKLATGPRGYSAAPPTSTEGVTEFRIRGAALRGDDDSGGRLSLLDRLRDTSIVGEGDSKSKKRKR